MKKLNLDLNHYSDDINGVESFMNDFFYLSIPRLIEVIYQAQNFKDYYPRMGTHMMEMINLYEKLKVNHHLWKEILKAETFLADVDYKKFMVEELFDGIREIRSKAIMQ